MELFTNIINCIWQTKEQKEFNVKIRENGLEIAINNSLEEIHKTILSEEIAMKFILQELDFANQENTLPQEFISNSGFHPLEYENTLNRFKESEKELLATQNIFDTLLRNIQKEAEISNASIKVMEDIMSKWEIGKYSLVKEDNQEKEIAHKEEIQQEEIHEVPIEVKEEIDISLISEPISEKIEEEKIPKPLPYDSKRVNTLMEEYSDIIGDIIRGDFNEKETKRIEEFKKHISQASLEGASPHAIVLSCFYEHEEPYNIVLPIKASEMNDVSLSFLQHILKGFSQQGFSETFLSYAEENGIDTILFKS